MPDAGNLPVEMSGFVGRASDLRAGLRLLSQARLVTVTGPAGVGKSRVALKLAESSRRRFPGGAWHLELSTVASPRTPAAADRRAALSATVRALAAAPGVRDIRDIRDVRGGPAGPAAAGRLPTGRAPARPGSAGPDPAGPAPARRAAAHPMSAGRVPAEQARPESARPELAGPELAGPESGWAEPARVELARAGVPGAIGDRRALIVLDTTDHLRDVVGPLVAVLLRVAPRLRVVVTARRPLGVAGERVLVVPPLPVDEALLLFEERGQAVDPDFVLTARTSPAARDICQSLDGLPLAIELAAARLRSLSVPELRERLDDPFDLLAGVSRTTLARHQGLRAALDWSHESCDARQRLLWARLSRFSGDFGVAAAESRCAGGDLPREAVAPALAELVAASIVLRDGDRHRMLGVFRRYGALRLRELGEETPGPRRPSAASPADVSPVSPVSSASSASSVSSVSPVSPVSSVSPSPPEPSDPDPSAPEAPPAVGTLSGRQLQVARLITEGLSNPKIAERLAIARRTVDAHVRNILTRSGLTSRAQVATWLAAEAGVPADPGRAPRRSENSTGLHKSARCPGDA